MSARQASFTFCERWRGRDRLADALRRAPPRRAGGGLDLGRLSWHQRPLRRRRDGECLATLSVLEFEIGSFGDGAVAVVVAFLI